MRERGRLNGVYENRDVFIKRAMDGLKRPHLGASLSRAIVRLNTCPSAAPSFDFDLSLKKQMSALVVMQLF